MKKLFWALSLALTMGITSCSSDDDNNLTNELENAFLYKGVERPLKASVVEFWGSEVQGSYVWDINLISSNFTVDVGSEEFDIEDDILSGILFELNTSTPSELQVGVYEIDEENFSPFKCSYADVLLDCDFSELDNEDNDVEDIEDACTEFFWLESGTIEILAVTSSTFTIKIDAFSDEGEAFKAHYSGTYLSFAERATQSAKSFNHKSTKQRLRK